MKVYIVGAGPGDPGLLTIKAKEVLEKADVVIYAGSLINPEILEYTNASELHNSAELTLEEILGIVKNAVDEGKTVVRLHSGDPSLYGAVHEQMDLLDNAGIEYEVIPGVSSILAAAASLKREYTVPEISQTLIITRLEGRTPVPKKESLGELAKHGCSLGLFLSTQMIEKAVANLRKGYSASTPVAVVYKASWDDEKIVFGCLNDIAEKVKSKGIDRTALILIGDFLKEHGRKSRLYSKDFGHSFREIKK